MKKFKFSPRIYEEYKNQNNDDESEDKFFHFLLKKYYKMVNYLKNYYLNENRSIFDCYDFIEEIISDKAISEEEYLLKFDKIPLKYLGYKKDDILNIYTFTPLFSMFNMALREVYKKMDKDIYLNYAKLIENKNRDQLGNIFCKMVNWNFDIKKTIFGEEIDHVLILNEIYRLVCIRNLISSKDGNYSYLIEVKFNINRNLIKNLFISNNLILTFSNLKINGISITQGIMELNSMEVF